MFFQVGDWAAMGNWLTARQVVRLGRVQPDRGARQSGGKSIGKPLLACKSVLAYTADMTDVFDALAAPARRAIFDVLAQRDEQTLFEITARLAAEHRVELTRQAVSQHLAVLENAGLLRTRRQGRYKFHAIDTAPLIDAVARWLNTKEIEQCLSAST
jgi:DNA-binding transcriptional ArsR family regulator